MPEPSFIRIAWCHSALIAFIIGVGGGELGDGGGGEGDGSGGLGGSHALPEASRWKPASHSQSQPRT